MSFRMGSRLRTRLGWTVAVAGAAALTVTGLAPAGATAYRAGAPAAQTPSVTDAAVPAGAVSPRPVAGTPELEKTSSTESIRQIVQCGTTMYAVGTFTEISQNGTTIDRNNIFSFSATAPYTVTSWNPDVNGQVNTIAVSRNCRNAYIGGLFTKVGATAVQNIAKIRTRNGMVVRNWRHRANGEVWTLLMVPGGHLLAGGKFTSINGRSADKYYASLSPSSGKNDGFLQLNISGHYHYCDSRKCSVTFPTEIYNQQLSHSGKLALAEGVFTSVGGQARQQIFMLNLATNPATVTGWTSPEWDGSKGNLPGGYPYQCFWNESFYIRAAAWSPGDSVIYTAETGNHPWNQPTGTAARTGLCDAVAAWPATQTPVLHTWVNYMGCDSLYSVAADNAAVYVAGHPRWADNTYGCNFEGKGAVPDPGLQGHSPATGAPLLNKNGKAVYTMSRANAGDMLITKAGLWIASSNRYGSRYCGERPGHAGICFLPYRH
jgi:hypothetical protein